jgi:hypothetical protein
VTTQQAAFHEAAADFRVESVSFAHLSIELGHLYMEDYAGGPESFRRHFRQIVPWVSAAREAFADAVPGQRARISTCFLVDDYFSRFSSPDVVLPALIDAARDSGLDIDYLGCESGCAEADEIPIAGLVLDRLVAEPAADTNGSRPPTVKTGWLSNGQPSSTSGTAEAMGAVEKIWTPPVQNAANRHSIYVDVELWDDKGGTRTWSCPFLAAVWQLLRLGMLRYEGAPVAVPQKWTGDFPNDWDRLPAIIALNPAAESFSAYRTLSVLSARFLPVEHAVRTILGQVSIDGEVAAQALARSGAEGMALAPELVDRVDYVFTGMSAVRR